MKLKILTMAILALSTFSFTACDKEGPAEKAGKKIDEAVEKSGDKIEEAGDKVEDALN